MRFHPIVITAGLLAAAAPPAAPPAAAQAGDCSRVFDFVTETVRANHAGWDDTVTPATRDSLDRLANRLRARAAHPRFSRAPHTRLQRTLPDPHVRN